MGTFLLVCIIGVVACMVIGTVLHALFWIVTLPFRIVFKVLFGLGGLLFGVILAPFVAVVAVIGIAVAVVAGILSLLTPLLPVLLLGLFGWAIYRAGSKKPVPPPPPPAFWS